MVEVRTLPRKIGKKELEKMMVRIIELVKNIDKLQIEKREFDDEMNLDIKENKKEMHELANYCSEKVREVEVECDVSFNEPEDGRKLITRLDTKETWEEDMTESEKQEDIPFPNEKLEEKTQAQITQITQKRKSPGEIKKTNASHRASKEEIVAEEQKEYEEGRERRTSKFDEFKKSDDTPVERKYNVFEETGEDLDRFLYEMILPGNHATDEDALLDAAVDYAKDIELPVKRNKLVVKNV